jgi:IPTL-CTERM motif
MRLTAGRVEHGAVVGEKGCLNLLSTSSSSHLGTNMATKTIRAVTLGLALLATMSTWAVAAPVTLNFTFANGAATAVGSITLETTLLNNPGNNLLVLPSPAVLALSVTVSGASAGNSTFGIGDFVRVDFNTNGVTLDFTHKLVGQSGPGGLWGPGGGGNFNFVSAAAPTPTEEDPFDLGANHGLAEGMILVQLGPPQATPPAPVQAPTLDEWILVLLALLVGAAGIFLIGRRGSPL